MQFKFSDLANYILDGMWAATGKAYYNPETGTNWCHLPMEMRMKCIEEMDYVTRIGLKRTAKTENLLVKSTKCHLNEFEVFPTLQTMSFSGMSSWDKFHRTFEADGQRFLKCVVDILEYCEIDTFEFWAGGERFSDLTSTVLSRDAPFRFKTFKSQNISSQINQFFLQNCKGVENVLLRSSRWDGHETKEWINLPSVVNAKLVQIVFPLDMEQPLFSLVQKWIENDAEIEKKLRFAVCDPEDDDDPIELFASIFKDRIISKDDEKVRIRTDNPTKHVILRCDKMSSHAAYFTCTIIPSDLLELPKDCEWAEEIHKWEFRHEADSDNDDMPSDSDSDSDSHSESEPESESD